MLHRITATTAVRAFGLFIDEAWSAGLPAQDCVLHVSPLVRELMAALADLPHQGRIARAMRCWASAAGGVEGPGPAAVLLALA
jgi:hypothetical protein